MNTVGTILYAEDNENDVFLMQQAFKKIPGTRVLKAVSDGDEAIAYLSGEGKYFDRDEYPLPKLLLLDIKMPRTNGFEVLEWVREKSSFPYLPVVMFSSSLEERDRDRAYALGANSFLIKPSQTEKLVTMMEALEGYWLKVNQLAPVPEPCMV